MAITPVFQVDLRSKDKHSQMGQPKDQNSKKRLSLHSQLAGADAVRAYLNAIRAGPCASKPQELPTAVSEQAPMSEGTADVNQQC